MTCRSKPLFHTCYDVYYEKKIRDKCWQGHGEKETRVHCWLECELVQPPWRTMWRYLIKLNTEPLYDPGTLLLGICPDKTVIQKYIL